MHLIVILYWSHDKLSNYLSIHIIKNMRKPIYILSTVFVLISMSCSYKTYKSIESNGNMENITAPQEDGALHGLIMNGSLMFSVLIPHVSALLMTWISLTGIPVVLSMTGID